MQIGLDVRAQWSPAGDGPPVSAQFKMIIWSAQIDCGFSRLWSCCLVPLKIMVFASPTIVIAFVGHQHLARLKVSHKRAVVPLRQLRKFRQQRHDVYPSRAESHVGSFGFAVLFWSLLIAQRVPGPQCFMRWTISQSLKWIISHWSLKLLENWVEFFFMSMLNRKYI